MSKNPKLIELWKEDCVDCEVVKPIVEELEREGCEFEKHNIKGTEGRRRWAEYEQEIDENSQRQGYETGYIYTPTFINPKTRKILAYSDRSPTKEELIELAGENEK